MKTHSNTRVHTRQQRLWVVFTDQTDLWWLKFLPKGFRHCFVIIHDGKNWITVDPLSNTMEVVVQDVPKEFDLPRWLKEQGHVVLRVRKMPDEAKVAPVMLFSCVEAVKRMIGVRERFILTPRQLYRHLQRPAKTSSFFERGVLSWEV
jgi:hypothetical protein